MESREEGGGRLDLRIVKTRVVGGFSNKRGGRGGEGTD